MSTFLSFQKAPISPVTFMASIPELLTHLGANLTYDVHYLFRQQPTLEAVAEDYRQSSHTPELMTSIWQTIWHSWARRCALHLQVPSCNRSADELEQLSRQHRIVIYVPDSLASHSDLHLFTAIFPTLTAPDSKAYEFSRDTYVKNNTLQRGWLDIDGTVEPPNMGLSGWYTLTQLPSQRREGLTLNTYIIGSYFSKLVHGRYFDEDNTCSLLSGSREPLFGIITAFFRPNGRLTFPGWPYDRPDYGLPRRGIRSAAPPSST